MNEKLVGYRKLGMAALIILIGIGAVYLRGDVPPNFVTLLEVIFGSFAAANGISKVANAMASRDTEGEEALLNAPAPPPVDNTALLAQIEQAFNQINGNLQAISNAIAISQQAQMKNIELTQLIISRAGFDKPRE